MKRLNYLLISALAALMLACGTSSRVPITGRKHSLLVSDAQILSLSKQEYSKFLKSSKLSTNAANTAMVKRVGQRLANAVETYLMNNGYQDEIKNFEWEFNLVADNHVNAFCMPGGKIVVYEGLLPVTQNEASLAIVLGHEIAHAVAKHSAEQMSKKMRRAYGTQIGGSILGRIGAGGGRTILLVYEPEILARQRVGGRPHGAYLRCYGRLRPLGGCGLLATHGRKVGWRKQFRHF